MGEEARVARPKPPAQPVRGASPAGAMGRVAATLASLGHATSGHGSYFAVHRRRYEAMITTLAEIGCGPDVLELGAYPYHLTAGLREAGFAVVGADLEPGRSGEVIEAFRLDVRRCDIEREKLPFPDERFDAVVVAEILEHLRVDPLFALAEANRVLRPDGRLVLTTPNLYSAQNIARFALGRGFSDPVAEFAKLRAVGHMGHVREYAPREVASFLRYAGFRVGRHRFADYSSPLRRRDRLKLAAAKVLPRRWLAFQEIVAVKAGPAPRLHPLR
jgi:SAM-dependent methyltransferase